jgi:hypothetical protein
MGQLVTRIALANSVGDDLPDIHGAVSIALLLVDIVAVVVEVDKLGLRPCFLCRFLAWKALVAEMLLLEGKLEVGL